MQPLLLLCVVAVSSGQLEGQGMAPPSFVNPDPAIGPTQVFYSGDGAQVTCEANGNPRPTVKLSQMRTTLNLTTTSQGVFQNVTEGTYQCVAENQYGTARSDNIHVRHVCIPGRQSLESRCHVCTGHHTSLQCWPVREGATPHYSWTFRSKEVPIDEKHYIDVKGNLHLVNVNDNDAGFYTCETKFPGGQVTPFTSNTTLSIRRYCDIGYWQATLGYLLAETENCPGSRLQTSPLVPGTDQWPNSGHTAMTRRPSTMTYNHLTTRIDPRSTLLGYQQQFPPGSWTTPGPYQQQSPSDLKATLWTYQHQPLYGYPLTLNCFCQGPQGPMHPNITWRVPTTTKSKMVTTADRTYGRLDISQVDHNDAGNYTCICSNSSGHTANSTKEITIQDPQATVFPPGSWTAPRPHQQQSSSDLKATLWTYQHQPLCGYPLTLECLCQGPQGPMHPNITWRVPTTTKSKMVTTTDRSHGRLNISQVDHNDTGNYTCICSNSSGHTANSTTEITIQDPQAIVFPVSWTAPRPYQQQSSSDLKATLWTYQKQPLYGDPMTLECLCQGPPYTAYPNITWSVPMATKSKLNTTADMYHRRLVIGQVDHSDTGNYTCICSNSSGHTANSTIEITIQAKYIWETQPVHQDVEIGGKAMFICAAKWSDNRICVSNTTWYINDGPTSGKSLGCPLCAVINNNVLFQNVLGPEANKNIQCNITCAGQSLYYNSYLHVDETDPWVRSQSSEGGRTMAAIGGSGGGAAFIFICVLIIFKRRKWIKMKWYQRKMDQSLKFRLELAKYNRSSHYVKFPTHTDEFPIDRLHFLDTLGAGNFGKVMKAEALDVAGTGKWELVAVKMCKDTATDAEKENLYHETIIMRKVPRHINVVTYLSYVASSEPTLLIMEYVPGGNLLQFLRNRRPQKEKSEGEGTNEGSGGEGGEHREEEESQKTEEKTQEHDALDQMNPLSSRDLSSFAFQIAKGMAHVATHNIIHRDLAARNILLGLGNVCKISDFGLSRDMEGSDEYEVSSVGPLPIRWMSPESLTDGLYTLKSDVWSYGVLLWELVTLGASPYSGQSARQVMMSVKEGRRLEKPDCCSDHVYKLMTQCWRPHPGDRPTFSDLADTIEGHLEEEAEYVQLSNFDVNIYDVIDMGDMDVAEEKV